MSKAMRAKRTNGPAVIRFTALLTQPALLNVPTSVGKKLDGMTTVEGTINGHPFRAPLERDSSGARALRVNKAMRNGAGAHKGGKVLLAILGPEPPPKPPGDLRAALTASRDAKTMWQDLTSDAQRIWIRWIEAAKTLETRARRVRRTVDQLAEGKRRPCCVNVYEFMLDRVQR